MSSNNGAEWMGGAREATGSESTCSFNGLTSEDKLKTTQPPNTLSLWLNYIKPYKDVKQND